MSRTRWSWLVLGLSLGACSLTSTRLVGWYVTRQIDGYLDLTSEQKGRIRPYVDAEIDRARREDLPHWLSLVRTIRDQVEQGPTEERVKAIQNRYDELLDAAVARLGPQFAPLLAELNEEQLARFQKRLLEFVDKSLPEQKLPPEERREEQDEKLIEAIEKIAGNLDDAQEAKLLSYMQEQPDDRPLRYKNERNRCYAFIKFLRTKPSKETIAAELERLWATRYDALGPQFSLTARRALQRRQLIWIHGLLTAKQRAHAVDHLTDQIKQMKRWLLPATS